MAALSHANCRMFSGRQVTWLAAVLGGTQSLHTNSLDEVFCLPSEQAAELALRTQQILAEETGVANTIDPLAGSYFIETMTNEIEEATWDYINKIDDMGGMIAAIEKGFPQMEIAEASYKFQRQLESSEKIMVGVNKYSTNNQNSIPLVEISEEIGDQQIKRLQDVRRKRDSRAAMKSLDNIKNACKQGDNVMPHCIEAVKNLATLQEICDVYRDVYGEYRDPGLY